MLLTGPFGDLGGDSLAFFFNAAISLGLLRTFTICSGRIHSSYLKPKKHVKTNLSESGHFQKLHFFLMLYSSFTSYSNQRNEQDTEAHCLLSGFQLSAKTKKKYSLNVTAHTGFQLSAKTKKPYNLYINVHKQQIRLSYSNTIKSKLYKP